MSSEFLPIGQLGPVSSFVFKGQRIDFIIEDHQCTAVLSDYDAPVGVELCTAPTLPLAQEKVRLMAVQV